MELYEIDPVHDCRWSDLVARSSASSMFHTPGWLEALQRTYGFQPVAFTDSPPGETLNNGLLFCRVASWMTGRRLVSLPFSDHCEPLVGSSETLSAMLRSLKKPFEREGRYIELRPLTAEPSAQGFHPTAIYCSHSIDLRPPLSAIFSGFHKNHTQRVIRRSERSGLVVEVGSSTDLLVDFYTLLTMTRRKHGAPVQPFSWFLNLVDCFGDCVKVYVTRHNGKPAASIFTVTHKSTLVFKYGGSNTAYNRFGGTSPLMWTAIQDAKERELVEFDLGRSDMTNVGLIAFKDHLGARRVSLTYYRYTGRRSTGWIEQWKPSVARLAYSLIPPTVQVSVGRGLYKHFA